MLITPTKDITISVQEAPGPTNVHVLAHGVHAVGPTVIEALHAAGVDPDELYECSDA